MTDGGRQAGGILANIKEIGRRIKSHNVMVSSAGIAFYGLLALVPTLIALVSVYGLVTDPEDIKDQVADVAGSLDQTTQDFIVEVLEDIVGAEAEQADAAAAEAAGEGTAGKIGRWLSLIFGIAVALFSASGAVQKLIGTISMAYEADETRPGWKLRLMAYAFTAAAVVGVSLMALVIGAAPALLDWLDVGGVAELALSVVQFPVLGILFGLALTVLYRNGPDRVRRTPWRNPGAVVATLLFIFFAIAFSIYSANVGVLPSSYGLLGSIAALMIFLQLTALAVIIGAEVNGAIEVGTASVPAGVTAGRQVTAGSPVMASAGAGSSAVVPFGSVNGSSGVGGIGDGSEDKTLSFGKALAGLVALFALARGLRD